MISAAASHPVETWTEAPATGPARAPRPRKGSADPASLNVAIALGTSQAGLRELGMMGVIPREGKRRFLLPPGTTPREVLRSWLARVVIDCPAAFTRYRRARRLLDLLGDPHDDEVLLALLRLFKGRRPSFEDVSHYLGKHHAKAATRRLDELAGRGFKVRVDAGEATLPELLTALPDGCHAVLQRLLRQRKLPEIFPPEPRHMARALALRSPELRALAATQLIYASVFRLKPQSVFPLIADCEQWDQVFPVGGCRDEEVVGDALDLIAAGEAIPLATPIECRRLAESWGQALVRARKLAKLALGDVKDMIMSVLPVLHPDPEGLSERAAEREEALSADFREERVDTVVDLVARGIEVLAAVENRVAQLEGVLDRVAARLRDVDAGSPALDRGVDCPGVVVRPDGSLGEGMQRVEMRVATEGELLLAAHARDPASSRIRRRLPPCPGDGHFRGDQHDHANWDRLYLVYERTSAEGGGECHEPFWVDLFRWGMLEQENAVAEGLRAERRRRVAEASLPQHPPRHVDLLTVPLARRYVARLARGDDPLRGDIVIPVVELYHALAYARLVLRYAIRHGARFAEIMQLRLGCFKVHPVDGVERPYVALKPKGWLDYGKFGLDPGTAEACRQVKALLRLRWFPDVFDEEGAASLPVMPFGSPTRRRDLPPARYLLVSERRALYPWELLHFVRALLVGVVDLRTHDGRYAYATLLGLDGAEYEEIGWLLHHRPGSRVTATYDLSDIVLAEVSAERFNRLADAGMIGRTAGG